MVKGAPTDITLAMAERYFADLAERSFSAPYEKGE
jgi:hypothetical protein